MNKVEALESLGILLFVFVFEKKILRHSSLSLKKRGEKGNS